MLHNIENIKRVRNAIAAAPPEGLKMGTWDCKTAACIGGWANRAIDSTGEPRDLLGLDGWEGYQLFYMGNFSLASFDELPAITRKAIAITVLDTLIETGKIDWGSALQYHLTEEQFSKMEMP